jgi:MFS family permease
VRLTDSVRVFLLIWFGQFVSVFGSGLTAFALGAWVYQTTGSSTLVSLVWLATTVPDLLLSPVAGALVDRWNRRRSLLVSDAGAALGTLAMGLLAWSGRLPIWQAVIASAWVSVFIALQWPAYTAAITVLVPKEQFGRANGMVQTAQSVAQFAAPVSAGFLLAHFRLAGVLLTDFATFFFSFAILLMVHIPSVRRETESGRGFRSLIRETAGGWQYIRSRPGLLALLLYFAGVNFFVGFVQVLLVPLVLSFTTATVLGSLMSIGGGGMIVASLLMSAWGGPRHRIPGVLLFTALIGLSVLLCGLKPSPLLVGVGLFGALFFTPFLEGSSQAIWQAKTDPSVLGRVFALRKMTALLSRPVAYVFAGPLADRVFAPLLTVGGPLAGSAGRLLGVGPGRGIGLLYVVAGLCMTSVAVAGSLYPGLRRMEREVPDADFALDEGA